MAITRDLLYAETCFFLKEPKVLATSQGPIATKIAALEESAPRWLLSQHPYNFSAKCEKLTLNGQTDPNADEPDASFAGWTFRYNKPATLRINWLSPSSAERDRITQGWADKGGFILSNFSPLYIDHCDPVFCTQAKIGYWPQTFLTAVASLIADKLVGPVTNSRGWEQDMSARSSNLIEESRLFDSSQTPAPTRRPGAWLRSRRSLGRGRIDPWR